MICWAVGVFCARNATMILYDDEEWARELLYRVTEERGVVLSVRRVEKKW